MTVGQAVELTQRKQEVNPVMYTEGEHESAPVTEWDPCGFAIGMQCIMIACFPCCCMPSIHSQMMNMLNLAEDISCCCLCCCCFGGNPFFYVWHRERKARAMGFADASPHLNFILCDKVAGAWCCYVCPLTAPCLMQHEFNTVQKYSQSVGTPMRAAV